MLGFANTASAYDEQNPESSAEIMTVFTRDREYLDKDHVRVGASILESNIENTLSFDDNVFRKNDNELDDYIYHFKPYLKLMSDWQRHEVYAEVSGDFATYLDYTGENYQDYSLGAGGRIDIDTYNDFELDFTHHQMHEDRGSPEDVDGKAPINFTQDEFNAQYNFGGERRVNGYLKLSSNYYNYDDNNKLDGTPVDNQYRNRLQNELTLRGEYEFKPDHSVFVQTSYNDRDYETAFRTNNGALEYLVRDSDGYNIRSGLNSKITGKAGFEVYLGYLSQDYEVSTREDIEEVYGGGEMIYNITGLTSLELGYKTYVRETTIENVSGILSERYYLNLEHELTRYVLLGAYYSQNDSDYQYRLGAGSRKDESRDFELKARYYVNKSVSIEGGYKYSDFDSSDSNSEFNNNNLNVGIKYEF